MVEGFSSVNLCNKTGYIAPQCYHKFGHTYQPFAASNNASHKQFANSMSMVATSQVLYDQSWYSLMSFYLFLPAPNKKFTQFKPNHSTK